MQFWRLNAHVKRGGWAVYLHNTATHRMVHVESICAFCFIPANLLGYICLNCNKANMAKMLFYLFTRFFCFNFCIYLPMVFSGYFPYDGELQLLMFIIIWFRFIANVASLSASSFPLLLNEKGFFRH